VYVFDSEDQVRGVSGTTLYIVRVEGKVVVFTDKPLDYAEPVYRDDSPVTPDFELLVRKARDIVRSMHRQ